MTKALAPEIKERYKVLYSAYTFADVAANPKENPYLFIPGPTYAELFRFVEIHRQTKTRGQRRLLLRRLRVRPGAHSLGREYAKKLGLKVVAEEVTKAGGWM